MPANNETIIEAFDSNQVCSETVAALHLGVRRLQVKEEQNNFTDIYDSQVDLGNIDEHYVQPGGNFWIARDPSDLAIAGFVGLMRTSETEGLLKRMSVLPEYRRRHIGTLLAGSLVDWARDNGYSTITLGTGEKENAKPIYEEVGFVETGRLMRNRDYLMELNLAAPIIFRFDGDQEDMDEIADFYLNIRHLLTASGLKVFTDEDNKECEELRHLDKDYIEPGGNFWVAHDIETDELVGTVGLRNEGDGTGTVERFGVSPSFRSQGTGFRLMYRALNWARRNGFRELYLQTGEKQKAMSIYKGLGFTIIGSMIEDRDYLMWLDLTKN